jgi:hypothetical protein
LKSGVKYVLPLLLDKEMVSLFTNMLKTSYYKHVMGSSTHQFTDVVVVAECIKQGVRSDIIFAPIKKKGFERKKKEVDHVEGSYRGKKNQFPNYRTPSPSSQIVIINFNPLFPTRKLEPQIKK